MRSLNILKRKKWMMKKIRKDLMKISLMMMLMKNKEKKVNKMRKSLNSKNKETKTKKIWKKMVKDKNRYNKNKSKMRKIFKEWIKNKNQIKMLILALLDSKFKKQFK